MHFVGILNFRSCFFVYKANNLVVILDPKSKRRRRNNGVGLFVGSFPTLFFSIFPMLLYAAADTSLFFPSCGTAYYLLEVRKFIYFFLFFGLL